MTGRGSWSASGVGGTRDFKRDRPGPYYTRDIGRIKVVDNNTRAVFEAVKVYQRALNRQTSAVLAVDGWFGKVTHRAVVRYQKAADIPGTTAWGGIGPETSEHLLRPYVNAIVRRQESHIPARIVRGLIGKESQWDAGAVGFIDDDDVGLAQINADAHPDWGFVKRIKPLHNVQFIVDYLASNLKQLDDDLEDAIAAYNLGVAGARRWIERGRPNEYTPPGSTSVRHVWDYINEIKAG